MDRAPGPRSGRLRQGVGQLSEILLVRENEGFGVDAKAQAGRWRAVLEDVAKVGVAAGTDDFRADHAVAIVLVGEDVLGGDRLKEAGPASAGMELGAGGKQRQSTADAGVNALAFVVQQRA